MIIFTYYTAKKHVIVIFSSWSKHIFSNFSKSLNSRKQLFLGKVFWKYATNLKENTHTEVRFQKSCIQFYWNRTSARIFSDKISAYFWNIWRAASEFKEIWKAFFLSLLNLTPRNCNEIILERKKAQLLDEKLDIFLHVKNDLHKTTNQWTTNELLIITSKLL